jgi:hypothetical protein
MFSQIVSSAARLSLSTCRLFNVLTTSFVCSSLKVDVYPNSLVEEMENLTMEDRPLTHALSPQFDAMLENDVIIKDYTKPTIVNHASSADFMRQMHGTTPIRLRHQGMPPRMSIQSTASNTSMASPFPVTTFMDEFVST